MPASQLTTVVLATTVSVANMPLKGAQKLIAGANTPHPVVPLVGEAGHNLFGEQL